MELNTRQYRNYYEILPGEGPRDIYATFSDSPGHDICHCLFQHPFQIALGRNGRRNLGVAISAFSMTNTPSNINSQNHTSVLFMGDDENAEVVSLRDGFYERVSQVVAEVGLTRGQGDFDVTFDHLGIVTYTGTVDLTIPYKHKDDKIPDNMASRFGFNLDTLIEQGTVDIDDYTCVTIRTGSTAEGPGDMFGPCSDCLITCDECIFTPETSRVVSFAPLAAYPPRAHVLFNPNLKFRPLHERPTIPELTFRLRDRANRPLSFLSGLPCAIIELMHLD
uniref:LO5 n=1 Tax=Carp adomavirus TaxID=2609874 RepID=A0A6F9F5K4_9VIRU|nr:TPA_asm: LO5 [Carp adomavirus]